MNNENVKILPENLELNLSDFALFLSVMKHKAAYECAVSIILDERDVEIRQVKQQKRETGAGEPAAVYEGNAAGQS